MTSDSELLLRYARERDEAAFAELVRGHIDLVYSAALRRLGGDAHAAAEVTQNVFLALARHANQLARHPVLNAWLHASTRNAAANFRRTAQRRERHHRHFHTMSAPESGPTSAAAWETIRPELDAALDELSEPDRQALILRFFEGRTYPAIGDALGVREEAVRMRVARALEKLRARLERQGITSTAAALGGVLSAHAVTAAPVGLAGTVTVASVSVAPAVGLLSLMSTAKTTFAVTAAIVLAGVGVVLYRASAPTESAPVVATVPAPPRPPPDEAAQRAAQLERFVADAHAQRPSAPPGARESEEKIAIIRDVLARLPEQGTPELKLATVADWHAAVEGPLESPEDYRRALAKLRAAAERRFAQKVQPALRDFLSANARQFPRDLSQLQPFVGPEIEPAMLQRYRVAPASEVPNVRMGGDFIITQSDLIDSEYDMHTVIGPHGSGSASSRRSSSGEDRALLEPVVQAYQAAHGREKMGDLAELRAFVTTPEQQAAVERAILRQQKPSR